MAQYNSPYLSTIQKNIEASRQARLANIQSRAGLSMARASDHLSNKANSFQQGEGIGAGDILQGAAGAVGLAGTLKTQYDQDLEFGQSPEQQFSATGEPIYNLGGQYNDIATSKAQGATGGEILGAAGQGAAIGADPALVAATGGLSIAAGAILGGGWSAITGGARKRKQQRQKTEAREKIQGQQQDFNQASESFDATQRAYQGYLDRADISDRIYNLYKI
jgi:hypothetical protein